MAKKRNGSVKNLSGTCPELSGTCPDKMQDSELVHRVEFDPELVRVATEISNEEERDKLPEPRRFTPKDCPMCESHRPKGMSFSRVYSTQGKIRYCRCGFCRHTWSQEGQ